MTRFPLILLFMGVVLSLVIALVIIVIGLNPPAQDIQQLSAVMFLTGSVTIFISYLAYRLGFISGFSSLRWSLLASVIIVVLLVTLNVWGTAQLMFLNEHDFVLTLSLLVFAGLIAIAFGLYIASTITARIRNLSGAAREVAEGKLDTRLKINGNDELSSLTRTFNQMADSLERMDHEKQKVEQARRELVAGVSHDLRTPLTAIRAIHEAILDGIVTEPEMVRSYIANSLTEVDNLNRLIDDLFELSKLNAGQLDVELMSASLQDLISETLLAMGAKAEQRKIYLKSEIGEGVDPVLMAPHKMQRVLHNLVDNALRYTPEDGEILVRAFRENGKVRLDVHNTGSLIASKDLPHIFDTFYRGELSRVREHEGYRSTGLGLAIVRGIIDAHKGRIQVDSDVNQGTTFQITLPQAI